ncbi:hypothetical protein [Nonomuraea sp. NPDC005501]|uniref:hypothetical protein n=1 Tax=Nonomuraea sp. NPDC005501 TaxID=3156884 RepID=UPI0033B2B2C7
MVLIAFDRHVGGRGTQPVKVRRLTDQEGQKLQRIVRRGTTSTVRGHNAHELFYAADGVLVTSVRQISSPHGPELFGQDPAALDDHLGALRALAAVSFGCAPAAVATSTMKDALPITATTSTGRRHSPVRRPPPGESALPCSKRCLRRRPARLRVI